MLKYKSPKPIDSKRLVVTLPKPMDIQSTTSQCRILLLPVELQIRIFVLAQNPAIVTVCKQFWELGQSVTVRAQYLMYRYGPTAILGKRSMKRKIVSLQVVEQLLRLNCCDPNGDYWLFTQACELKQINLCRWIIDSTLSIEKLPQEQQKIMRHFLNISSMKGAIPIIDLLVDNFGIDIHQGEENALTLACKENQLDTVKHLIYKYGCDVHCHNEKHLRNACLQGYKELVQFIISIGADIHSYNDAALQNAVYKGFSSLVKLLLDTGANPEANQNACIQHAITNRDVDSVKYLVSAGVDPRCNHDWPLKYACRNGFDDIVAYLIDVISVENVTNIRDGMPLEECLKHDRVATIQLLLYRGADPNTKGAIRGLKYIVNPKNKVKNRDLMIKLLIEAGLDLNQQSDEMNRLFIPFIQLDNQKKATQPTLLSWI